MIQIKPPTIKEFPLKVTDDKLAVAGADEARDGYITFRQASTREVEQRNGETRKRRWTQEEEVFSLMDEVNWDRIARLECWLTCEGTDIQLRDGSFVEFERVNGISKPKERAKFDLWWDQLDPDWARAIHTMCLEVNPQWSAKSGSIA